MNRKIYLYFLTATLLFNISGNCRVLEVGKDKAFHSISQALDLAGNGDSIFVYPGLYKERELIIRKTIYLKGINYPVIDGENKYGVFIIQANNVVLDGFKVQHSGRSEITDIAGIMLESCHGVSITNNILDDTNFGIYSQHASNCFIKNNRITAYGKNEVQSGNGIHAWRSDSLYIIGNTITGHRDGLYFEFVTNSLIWRNISHKNVRYGIHFMFSHHDTYISNVFEQNESGVAVMYTNHIKMFNNFFLDNWGAAAYGILLKDITDSDISGNHFTKNTTALHMEGCSRINLYKNIFINNGWAVKIQASCDNIDFTKNNFIGNTFDIGTNGSLVLNTFNGNYWDKYEGYDINKDGVGDVPYHPVSMYSMIIESNAAALMLFRSLIVTLLDKSEKVLPGITPENLKDNTPQMKPWPL
ncbi:MAG: nitrous oxide reductase family maturation protein NosD [Bacteroidetes bacterium]|nr:nitrous oxide reductase family maturation protein NosD [Bacteroidota bacterium]